MIDCEIFLEWLEPFTDYLEDTETPAPAQISQDSDSDRTTKVAGKFRKHRICTHFPKSQDCDVCWRTKITRALCRRRAGEALPRAEKFGDLITADHKVLNEECESRNNHRYAVVVQDLATQWNQSCLCKNKTSQETEKCLKKFLGPTRKPKVIYTLEFGNARLNMESLYVCTSPFRIEWDCWESGTEDKEGNLCCTVAVRLGREMVGAFHGMLLLLRNVQDLLVDGKTLLMQGAPANHLKDR